jgi:hypothetical protein
VNILLFDLFIQGAPGIGVLLVGLVGVQAYIDKAKFRVLV